MSLLWGDLNPQTPLSVPHRKRSLDRTLFPWLTSKGHSALGLGNFLFFFFFFCTLRHVTIQEMKGCQDSSQAGEFLQPWGSQLTNFRKQTSVHAFLSPTAPHPVALCHLGSSLSLFSNTSIIPSFSHSLSCLTCQLSETDTEPSTVRLRGPCQGKRGAQVPWVHLGGTQVRLEGV